MSPQRADESIPIREAEYGHTKRLRENCGSPDNVFKQGPASCFWFVLDNMVQFRNGDGRQRAVVGDQKDAFVGRGVLTAIAAQPFWIVIAAVYGLPN
jgi:hypothetical protein